MSTSKLSTTFKALQKAGYIARQNINPKAVDSINHPLNRLNISRNGNRLTQRWDMGNLVAKGAVWTHKDNSSDKNGIKIYYVGSKTEATNRSTQNEVGKAIETLLIKNRVPVAGHFTSEEFGDYILIPPHSQREANLRD